MQILTLVLFLSIASVATPAQTQDPASRSGKFQLQLQGKQIGSADYDLQPTETGWAGTAHYDFNLGTQISATRRLTFLKSWSMLTETYAVTVNGTPQSLTLSPNATRSKFTFHADAAGQQLNTDFDLQPHTVVLPNFDAAGLQVLLNMQAADPAPGGNYFCFIPSGPGTLLPCTLTAAGKGAGTLDGKPIDLVHWLLQIGPVQMDVRSSTTGALMQAEVASQAVDYTRTGFTLNPQTTATTPAPTPVPAYAIQREVTFPSDGLTVPGTLTLPANGKTPVPIAVLVQGSGVQDRDETVGANKVFQQLAWGLAQRGIATLRYDRRPKFAPADFAKHLDLDHEVVIDAASALAYSSTLTEADPKSVFLIGHSLGAQLAPYIVLRRLAAKPDSVRGYILLAGVETPIDQTILRQVAEFGKAQGATDEQIKASLAKWQTVFDQVNDPKTPDDKAVGPGNVTALYWRDWMKRDPAAVMKSLNIPALVLRGEYDRNVTHQDFLELSAATKTPQSNKEFPGLNHLFMPVPTPDTDELLPGTIAPEVLDTVSGWIDSLTRSTR